MNHIRSECDHEIWNRDANPLPRPVVVIGSEKEIPPLHVKTNLATLRITAKEFEKMLESL